MLVIIHVSELQKQLGFINLIYFFQQALILCCCWLYISEGAPAQGEHLLPWFPSETLAVVLWEHRGFNSMLVVQAFHGPQGTGVYWDGWFTRLTLTVGSNHNMGFSWRLYICVHGCLGRRKIKVQAREARDKRVDMICDMCIQLCVSCIFVCLFVLTQLSVLEFHPCFMSFVLKLAHCSVWYSTEYHILFTVSVTLAWGFCAAFVFCLHLCILW